MTLVKHDFALVKPCWLLLMTLLSLICLEMAPRISCSIIFLGISQGFIKCSGIPERLSPGCCVVFGIMVPACLAATIWNLEGSDHDKFVSFLSYELLSIDEEAKDFDGNRWKWDLFPCWCWHQPGFSKINSSSECKMLKMEHFLWDVWNYLKSEGVKFCVGEIRCNSCYLSIYVPKEVSEITANSVWKACFCLPKYCFAFARCFVLYHRGCLFIKKVFQTWNTTFIYSRRNRIVPVCEDLDSFGKNFTLLSTYTIFYVVINCLILLLTFHKF